MRSSWRQSRIPFEYIRHYPKSRLVRRHRPYSRSLRLSFLLCLLLVISSLPPVTFCARIRGVLVSHFLHVLSVESRAPIVNRDSPNRYQDDEGDKPLDGQGVVVDEARDYLKHFPTSLPPFPLSPCQNKARNTRAFRSYPRKVLFPRR